ncbi:hypothetical protein CH380_05345 [Leptospira adleri]|uniref:Uncharacterized protein n=1 Tax=Leptospira adleri TaxID=2023186 RepID=A0A2M9YSI0_9LEPT|nr:hypothetical protein CH380_05345 [Leptospira adleri]
MKVVLVFVGIPTNFRMDYLLRKNAFCDKENFPISPREPTSSTQQGWGRKNFRDGVVSPTELKRIKRFVL